MLFNEFLEYSPRTSTLCFLGRWHWWHSRPILYLEAIQWTKNTRPFLRKPFEAIHSSYRKLGCTRKYIFPFASSVYQTGEKEDDDSARCWLYLECTREGLERRKEHCRRSYDLMKTIKEERWKGVACVGGGLQLVEGRETKFHIYPQNSCLIDCYLYTRRRNSIYCSLEQWYARGYEMLDLSLVHGQIVRPRTGRILHSDSDIDSSRRGKEQQRQWNGWIWKGDENWFIPWGVFRVWKRGVRVSKMDVQVSRKGCPGIKKGCPGIKMGCRWIRALK